MNSTSLCMHQPGGLLNKDNKPEQGWQRLRIRNSRKLGRGYLHGANGGNTPPLNFSASFLMHVLIDDMIMYKLRNTGSSQYLFHSPYMQPVMLTHILDMKPSLISTCTHSSSPLGLQFLAFISNIYIYIYIT